MSNYKKFSKMYILVRVIVLCMFGARVQNQVCEV